MRQFGRKFLMGCAVATLIGGAAACTDFSHPPESLGRIQIQVVDSATNGGVGNITSTLMLEDQTPWRQVTTATDGTGEFGTKDGGIIPGKFLVYLDLGGKGYQLAAGETNYKPVRSIIGQTSVVTFKLHKGIDLPAPGS
ncbi:MAG TPA: hypothetical protein VD758_00495 [Gemmatimonadaceae bacterium]|nr:hypothetical protein [Gemmatimonadaceae bacterium]